MPATKDREKRQSIIDACLRMNALGINQGTSGNISLRHGDGMLITPTSTPYEAMQPEQIVYMHLDGAHDPAQRPSSEWRFHRDILKARPEVERDRARPSALLDDAGDHGHGDSAGALHGRRAPAATPSAARPTRPSAPRNSPSTPFARWRDGWPACWPITA